jgi:hypothetical protein
VVGVARERVTIDLRGLAPALEAHAKARHLTVSQVARLALVAALPSAPNAQVQPVKEPSSEADRLIKLTIRLRRGVAARLAHRARSCGLSQGAYLTTLLDGAPAPPLGLVRALAESSDELAILSADANEVIRMLRKGVATSDTDLRRLVQGMVQGTRQHLDLASRVVAQVRPTRVLQPPRLRNRNGGQGSNA